jgi:hypothetical protein
VRRRTLEENMARIEERAERSLPSMVPQPTEIHNRLAEALDGLLTMAVSNSNGEVPIHVRTIFRALHSLRPMIAEELAKHSEEEIRDKMLYFHTLLDTELFDKLDDHALAGTDQPSQG